MGDLYNRTYALGLAEDIGKHLEFTFPALSAIKLKGQGWVLRDERGGPGVIPGDNYKEIAEVITDVVAEIIQAWLDAGSEREVTLEELGPVIEEHVKGWSTTYGD